MKMHRFLNCDRKVDPPIVFVDNQSAICIMEAPGLTRRAKHMQLRYMRNREVALSREMSFQYVATDNNIADMLTKVLTDETKFHRFRDHILGERQIPELRIQGKCVFDRRYLVKWDQARQHSLFD